MEKKLPIQIVEFREKDDFLPEGGGGKPGPKATVFTLVKAEPEGSAE